MSPSSSNAMMHFELVCCLVTFASVAARETGQDATASCTQTSGFVPLLWLGAGAVRTRSFALREVEVH